MVGIGFPEASTRIELNLLSEIFSPETLNKMFFNPSNGLQNSFVEGRFSDLVKVDDTSLIWLRPKALFWSSAAATQYFQLLSTILSYICGNVTVCQLSKLNGDIISRFIESIRPIAQTTRITRIWTMPKMTWISLQILIEIPWNIINVWGGEEATTFISEYTKPKPASRTEYGATDRNCHIQRVSDNNQGKSQKN